MIDEEKSLQNLVAQFVKQNPKHIAEAESRNNKEAKREAKLKQLEAIVEKTAPKDSEEPEEKKSDERA